MPRFICKICKSFDAVSSSPPAKCPKCGNSEWEIRKAPILRLKGHAREIIVFEDVKKMGRDCFSPFGRDLSRYVSAEQFTLRTADVAWEIEGSARATNPTLLNGSDISSLTHALKAGDVLEVGPLKLTVEIGP